MNYIQVGDTFFDPEINETVKILFIPEGPGQPWIVQTLNEPQRKYRLWTEGVMTKTFSQSR